MSRFFQSAAVAASRAGPGPGLAQAPAQARAHTPLFSYKKCYICTESLNFLWKSWAVQALFEAKPSPKSCNLVIKVSSKCPQSVLKILNITPGKVRVSHFPKKCRRARLSFLVTKFLNWKTWCIVSIQVRNILVLTACHWPAFAGWHRTCRMYTTFFS